MFLTFKRKYFHLIFVFLFTNKYTRTLCEYTRTNEFGNIGIKDVKQAYKECKKWLVMLACLTQPFCILSPTL